MSRSIRVPFPTPEGPQKTTGRSGSFVVAVAAAAVSLILELPPTLVQVLLAKVKVAVLLRNRSSNDAERTNTRGAARHGMPVRIWYACGMCIQRVICDEAMRSLISFDSLL
jgi:hypothetical protein